MLLIWEPYARAEQAVFGALELGVDMLFATTPHYESNLHYDMRGRDSAALHICTKLG
jgi:hypothetical protein